MYNRPKTFAQMMESLKTGGFTQKVGGKKVFTPIQKASPMSGGVPVTVKGYKVPKGFAQTGQRASGQPVYTQMQITPAPKSRKTASKPAPAPAPAATLQISDEAKAYRAESERILKEAQDLRATFAQEEEQAKAARELQQKLFIEAQQGVASQIQKEREAFQSAEAQRQANIEAEFQRTKAYDLEKAQTERARQQNIARAARSANVGIAPAGSAEPGGTTVQRTTGTQAFKRRPFQINPAIFSALGGIGRTSNLNI